MKKLHKMINNAMAYAKNKDSVLSYMMKVYSHFKHRYYSEQWKDDNYTANSLDSPNKIQISRPCNIILAEDLTHLKILKSGIFWP